ncbi:MAG TPA: hypothetical protein PK609_03570 [Candidatus Paceibacterota bacterium]|nr:hypothetical protein [Candidatus Paceibacterota bacterium]
MLSEPIEPLTPPVFLMGASTDGVLSIVFLVLFIIWTIYTLVAAYHWLRYGHRSAVAIPALIVHVVVSWLLAGYAASGLIA